jgi:hypothetical protein
VLFKLTIPAPKVAAQTFDESPAFIDQIEFEGKLEFELL